jgi:hypothetical protein
LVAQGRGLIEGKIYQRQVSKEGLAARVVDKQEVKRLYDSDELADLFDRALGEGADVADKRETANGEEKGSKDGKRVGGKGEEGGSHTGAVRRATEGRRAVNRAKEMRKAARTEENMGRELVRIQRMLMAEVMAAVMAEVIARVQALRPPSFRHLLLSILIPLRMVVLPMIPLIMGVLPMCSAICCRNCVMARGRRTTTCTSLFSRISGRSTSAT